MKKIEILVFGKNPKILQTVVRLINANEAWQGEGTMDEEVVIEKCQRNNYDLLLLGGGISAPSENKVRATLRRLNPDLKIIQHFGGGSDLLSSEIESALAGDDSANFNIVDNPFYK
ncbi:MAG: hypothetical protein ACI9XB_004622 [Gammaproteobacteria bacterium]|jgi:hypothetical protein